MGSYKFLSLADQVKPRFVNVDSVEASLECSSIAGDLVEDEVHPVLLVIKREEAWSDAPLNLLCPHGINQR